MSIFDAFAKLEAERKAVSPPSWLLVGLGNPDRKYENTRHNTGFICVDRVAKELGTEILRKKFDALVVDPPRTGLDDRLIETILAEKPTKFCYVSCNMATLARNLARLTPTYRVDYIQPVDMLPQTPRCEAVVKLSLAAD